MADEGSLDTQEQRLRSAVSSRQGCHEVLAVFREEGASGKSLDRPALRRLLAAIEADQVDLVMVTRIDRLSRSLMDFFELQRVFEAHRVQFFSLNETFDTSSPLGRAMLKLLLTFAELEREQTVERTRVAMLARAQRGVWNGGHPILGYASDGAGHLSVVAEESAVVRAAFDRFLQCKSPAEVARWLNDQGLRQKRYASRRRGDVGERPFSPPVLRHMLADRRYLGEVCHSGDWYPGQHEGIVDGTTFERAQGLLADNRQGGQPPSRSTVHQFLLTGLVRCGSCGRALTTVTSHGRAGTKYPYYRCTSTTKRVDIDCKVGQLPADTLEAAVIAVVRQAAREPRLVAQALEEAERIAREELEPARQRLDLLRAELATVKSEASRILDVLLASGIDRTGVAKDRLTSLSARQAQLEASVAAEEGKLAVTEGTALDMDLVATALRDFDLAFDHLGPAEQKEFLAQMIDQVVAHRDRVEVGLYDGRQATVDVSAALAARIGGKAKRAAEASPVHADRAPVHALPGLARTRTAANDAVTHLRQQVADPPYPT
jgi:site-specific DNA recombinase